MELPASQIPWLMLSEDRSSSSTRRAFFSLADRKDYEIELPEAEGKYCAGSSLGWLVVLDDNFDLCLLNPFTRAQIQLPPLPKFKGHGPRRHMHVQKIILSSCPLTDNCVALAIYNDNKNLAFCKPGRSTEWIKIVTHLNPFLDAAFYRGSFYSVNFLGRLVVVCDLGTEPKVKEVLSSPKSLSGARTYLVDTSEALLLVARDMQLSKTDCLTFGFKVYIQVESGSGQNSDHKLEWKKVTNLRDLALFIGGNSSICLYADGIPGCKRNCIYFTEDCPSIRFISKDGAGSDMGVFNLEDRSIEPLYCGRSRSTMWPPLWVEPCENIQTLAENGKSYECSVPILRSKLDVDISISPVLASILKEEEPDKTDVGPSKAVPAQAAGGTPPSMRSSTEAPSKEKAKRKGGSTESSSKEKAKKRGKLGAVTEEDIRAFLLEMAPVTAQNFIAKFSPRLKKTEDSNAFFGVLGRICKVQFTNKDCYVVLKDT